MKKLLILIVALLVLALPSLTFGVTEHCPDGGEKVEVPFGWDFEADGPYSEDIVIDGVTITVTIDGDTVTFTDEAGDPIEVEFCIKSSNEAFPDQTGSGGSTPDGQDISYVSVFALVVEEATPTPTPTPSESQPEEPSEPGEPSRPEQPTGGGTPPDTAMDAGAGRVGFALVILLLLGLTGLTLLNLRTRPE